jgi:hypothetical protein
MHIMKFGDDWWGVSMHLMIVCLEASINGSSKGRMEASNRVKFSF